MLNIKQRQLNLKTYYQYYKGSIDGIEGNQLKSAYKLFQQQQGLSADGIYGQQTENKLIEKIKYLQGLLNNKGYGLSVDGIVGTATINAIKDFQSKNGLTADGIVGNATMSKLNSLAPTPSSSLSWSDIKHFKKEDFTCQCGCGLNNMDLKVVKILDNIRDHYGKPIIVTSGTRCVKHNAEVAGSVSGSRHTQGKAIDFYVKGVSASTLLAYTKTLVSNGTLRYTYTNSSNMNGVVHIDIN